MRKETENTETGDMSKVLSQVSLCAVRGDEKTVTFSTAFKFKKGTR